MSDAAAIAEAPSLADRLRTWWRPTLIRDYGIVVAFVLLFIALAISTDGFFSVQNFKNVFFQNAPLGIVACGITIAMISGGFDLSVGAIFAMAGVVSAWVASNFDPTVGIITGMLVGIPLGLFNGLVITRIGINSFIATLATSLMFAGITVLISGGFLVQVADESFRTLGAGDFFGLKNASLVFFGFALITGLVLARSRFGRYAYATGGNDTAARLSGVRVDVVRTLSFVISGFAASLAGVIAASRISQGQADVGTSIALDAIAAAVVGGVSIFGGVGAIWRTVLGVFFLAIITNGFNIAGIASLYKNIMTGGIIIIAVAIGTFARRD